MRASVCQKLWTEQKARLVGNPLSGNQDDNKIAISPCQELWTAAVEAGDSQEDFARWAVQRGVLPGSQLDAFLQR